MLISNKLIWKIVSLKTIFRPLRAINGKLFALFCYTQNFYKKINEIKTPKSAAFNNFIHSHNESKVQETKYIFSEYI